LTAPELVEEVADKNKYEHLKKLKQAFSEPYRGRVYHYTSAEGISGIIDKHEIWMSNIAFTNDTTELKALANATGILKDKAFANDAVKEAWCRMADRTHINEITQPDFYMASFSRKRDSLEPWRAYGNFCIGFDAKQLAIRRHVSLYKCLYADNAILKWILEKERITELDSLPDEDRRNAAYNLLYVASMKYKNRCFSIEKEEAAKQRELLPIKEVIVGPMAYQREAKTACEILLCERGYKQVTVKLSEIPYRGI
jgi:nuclear transport factor 2 (NTF2) superfamily protein